MNRNPLIGKTISALWIAKDKHAIKFDIDGSKPIIVRTEGECCSVTWIENVDLPENCVGSAVVEVSDIKMPDAQIDNEHDCLRFYGTKIVTGKGETKIDYRNSSNGYYGGGLIWPDERFCGGVYDQNVSSEDWVRLA